MKKTFIIATLLIASVAISFAADLTARARISYNGTTLTLREAATYSDGFDNGSDALLYNTDGIAANKEIAGQGNQWIQWASNDLEGLPITFKALAAGEQTFSFSNVIGTLYLVDAVANKTTEITEGGSYVFTAEDADVANWNTTRFSITKVAPLPDYLFVDGIVTIGELKDGETIYFQYFTYVDGKRVNGIAGDTNRNKSFEPYTTEGYCEIWYTNKADVERKFIVNPAPVVTPAN